ncbi:putative tricarboxylic transport membrane protein [Methylopila capsulata]|uniref:Tricarboxylic transport membrane protein n=1 Tax=Methylopila capsulata TaxID=61654 RepID=A0A9W6IS16_9HYPH|nr:tripartite tricarboxylate transporter substrate-binding protein [Methylopila capsulata]MBM7850136.1 putative tricarboxylic transport membrane protein [Methylopila capsulata]GLK55428.1 hypothetical protein GCM10008170_14470 [Methylopila capsulata]
MLAPDRRTACRAIAALLAAGALPRAARAALNLEIIAPAALGDSLDQVARALAEGLNQMNGAVTAAVTNAPGQGGFTGLERFVNAPKTKPLLLATSLGTLGATILAKRALTLDDTVPVQRICGEHLVLLVPERSPLQTLGDLSAKLRQDPSKVLLAGRELGSASHMLCLSLARAYQLDPKAMRYIAIDEPGEMFRALMSGKIDVVAGGVPAYAQQLKGGSVRALAISAGARVDGFDAPTFRDSGVDLELVDWRGLAAPNTMDPSLVGQIAEAVALLMETPAWANALGRRHWLPLHLKREAYATFLGKERDRVAALYRDAGLI